MSRKRPHLTSTVDAKTLVIVNQVIEETGLTTGKALDLIIYEWRAGIEIEPIKSTPNIGGLSDLGESLKNIEERLNQIEG